MTIEIEAKNERELLIQIAASLNDVTNDRLPRIFKLIGEIKDCTADHEKRINILESKNVAAWTGGIAGGTSAVGLVAYLVGKAAGWW